MRTRITWIAGLIFSGVLIGCQVQEPSPTAPLAKASASPALPSPSHRYPVAQLTLTRGSGQPQPEVRHFSIGQPPAKAYFLRAEPLTEAQGKLVPSQIILNGEQLDGFSPSLLIHETAINLGSENLLEATVMGKPGEGLKILVEGFDDEPPLVRLESPAAGFKTSEESLAVEVSISDAPAGVAAGAVSLFVNGVPQAGPFPVAQGMARGTIVRQALGWNLVVAQGLDRAGNLASDSIYVEFFEKTSLVLDADGGTVLGLDGKIRIDIPSGALTEPTSIEVKPIQFSADGKTYDAIEISPHGVDFKMPVTLTFTYDPDALEPGLSEYNFSILRWNPDRMAFQHYPAVYDTVANTVQCTTSTFSTWMNAYDLLEYLTRTNEIKVTPLVQVIPVGLLRQYSIRRYNPLGWNITAVPSISRTLWGTFPEGAADVDGDGRVKPNVAGIGVVAAGFIELRFQRRMIGPFGYGDPLPVLTWNLGFGGFLSVALGPFNPSVGTTVSLEAGNFPGLYVRHNLFVAKLTPILFDIDRQDASFNVVPGLADNSLISFESVNYPDYFLRAAGTSVILQPAEDNGLFRAEATFRQVPGLANSGLASFESHSRPGHYLRHQNFLVWLQPFEESGLYRDDATFRVAGALWQ